MGSFQPIHLLYIEDDIVVALLVREVLEQHGYQVDLATNGEEGLAKLATGQYDAVAVDYQLPSMNGLQVLGLLAQNELPLPTVMITGAGDERVAVEAMKLGAGDYIIKNEENYLNQLPFIIQRVIEKQKHLQEKAQRQQCLQNSLLEFLRQVTSHDFSLEEAISELWENTQDQLLEKLDHPLTPNKTSLEQTVMAEVLRHSEEQLRTFIEGVNDMAYFQKLDGSVFPLNTAVARLTGYSLQEFKENSQLWQKIIHPNDLSIAQVLFHTTDRTMPSEYEFRIQTKAGQWRWIHSRSTVVRNNKNDIIGYNCIGRDITERKQAERNLRKERDFIEAVLATITSLVIVLDRQGRIIGFNHACEQLTGYTFKEIKNILLWELLILPQEIESVKHIFNELLSQQLANQYENIWLTKHQEYRLINWSNTVLTNGKGEVDYIIGTGTDITIQRHNEKMLREREQTLQAILSATADSVFFCEIGGQLVVVNPTAAERLGRKPEELVGQIIWEVFPATVSQTRKRVFDEAVCTKTTLLMEDKRDDIWFESHVCPVLNEAGEVVRVAIFARDITQRKLAEGALQESEKKYRAIINSTSEGYWLLDSNTQTIIETNSSLCRMLGYELEEMIGKTPQNFSSHQKRNIIKIQISKTETAIDPTTTVVEITEHKSYEEILKKKNGEELVARFNTTTVRNLNGRVLKEFAFITDITQRKRAETDLEHLLYEQQAILNNSMVGIAFISANHKLLRINRKLSEIFGYPEKELTCQQTEMLYPSPQDYLKVKETISQLFQASKTYTTEQLMRHQSGQLFWCRLYMESIDIQDLSKGYIWTVEDINEQKRAEENLRLAATVFETASEAILLTNDENKIIAVNSAFTVITGYSESEVLGRNPRILSSGRHNKTFYAALWESLLTTGRWQGEIWNRRKNGEVYPEWLSIVTIREKNNNVKQYVAIFSDITQRKQDEAIIQYQANFDSLTDLPNRMLFMDRLTQEIYHASRENTRLALMFIDLDRFKWVNDNLGHPIGDRLLQDVAQRLKSSVRTSDTVARLGGDEFTAILPKINGIWDVKVIAERILSQLTAAFLLEEQEVFISGSIGIALFPDDAGNHDHLLKNADIAMYHAKESGRNTYQFFTAEMNQRLLEHQKLEMALRRASERHELLLYYQPIIDVSTEQVVATEALLRWQMDKDQLLLPEQFLPLAEDTGLIIPIGQWSLQQAMTQLVHWHTIGFSGLQMAINVSLRQLRSSGMLHKFIDLLEHHQLSSETLIIELTENLFLNDSSEILNLLNQLKNLGVQIAVDDFGTGYSSLSYLRQFPIDFLKIDSSFVRQLNMDAYHTAHVEAMISLAHRLDIVVVGEGVETQEQFDFLRSYHCDRVQGQYFSLPLVASAFEQFAGQYH